MDTLQSSLEQRLAGRVARLSPIAARIGVCSASRPRSTRAMRGRSAAILGASGLDGPRRPARFDPGDRVHDVDPDDAARETASRSIVTKPKRSSSSSTAKCRVRCWDGDASCDVTLGRWGLGGPAAVSCSTRCSTRAAAIASCRPCSPSRSRCARNTPTRPLLKPASEGRMTPLSLLPAEAVAGAMIGTVEIAGGGIAGLTTGLAFARKGWRVRVHEQDSDLRILGAGIYIWEKRLAGIGTRLGGARRGDRRDDPSLPPRKAQPGRYLVLAEIGSAAIFGCMCHCARAC